MSKQRYLAAFGAAGLVFAGVFGAAAALNVDGGNAQAGQDKELSCQTKPVKVVGYAIEQGTGAEPVSAGVVLSNIDGPCQGLYMSARVLDGSGNLLANGVKQIGGTGNFTVNFEARYGPTTVPVSQIQAVSLAIT